MNTTQLRVNNIKLRYDVAKLDLLRLEAHEDGRRQCAPLREELTRTREFYTRNPIERDSGEEFRDFEIEHAQVRRLRRAYRRAVAITALKGAE